MRDLRDYLIHASSGFWEQLVECLSYGVQFETGLLTDTAESKVTLHEFIRGGVRGFAASTAKVYADDA